MEFDIKNVLFVVLRKFWVIVTIAVIAFTAVYSYNKFVVAPLYSSSVVMYVNNNFSETATPNVNTNTIEAARKLVSSYAIILKTDEFLTKVIENANVDGTPQLLRSRLKISSINNTEFFETVVIWSDPLEAAAIANAISDLSDREITGVMTNTTSVRVVSRAKADRNPISPKTLTNAIIGGVGGLVLAVIVVLAIEMFDIRIKDEEDLVANYKVPLLGIVPLIVQE